MAAAAPLIQARALERHYPVGRGFLRRKGLVRALDGVSFIVREGETLAVVGESGCGKSTLARQVTMIERPTGGSLCIDGDDVATADRKTLKRLRPRVQMVFQNPFASLNPRKKVGTLLEEPLALNTDLTAAARLDVSIQAQVLNLLMELQQELGIAYLFISHNLQVVRHIAGTVMVMYLGKSVEYGPKAAVFERPAHPYTKALLASTPTLDARARRERITLKGELPSPLNPPSGCAFHTRCPYAIERCRTEVPALLPLGDVRVACHRAAELL